jgi:predicted CoA-binding protein
MEPTKPVPELLQDSRDPDNPTADEIVTLLEAVKRIAVVGMSRSPEKAARRVPGYLASKGYEIIPVNPTADRILGKLAVDCLDDITEPVDMVLVFRPSKDAARVMERAMKRPERPAIWLQEGILAPETAKEARAGGITVVQDLCAYKVHAAYSGGMKATAPA